VKAIEKRKDYGNLNESQGGTGTPVRQKICAGDRTPRGGRKLIMKSEGEERAQIKKKKKNN